jgi:hypothetical protein
MTGYRRSPLKWQCQIFPIRGFNRLRKSQLTRRVQVGNHRAARMRGKFTGLCVNKLFEILLMCDYSTNRSFESSLFVRVTWILHGKAACFYARLLIREHATTKQSGSREMLSDVPRPFETASCPIVDCCVQYLQNAVSRPPHRRPLTVSKSRVTMIRQIQ